MTVLNDGMRTVVHCAAPRATGKLQGRLQMEGKAECAAAWGACAPAGPCRTRRQAAAVVVMSDVEGMCRGVPMRV